MIIDGYVVPDDLTIEELKASDGHVVYYCKGFATSEMDSILYHFCTARLCTVCGKFTHKQYQTMCDECADKEKRNRYLAKTAVQYKGQPVFVGDDLVTDRDLSSHLSYLLLCHYTLDDILNLEIFEAEPTEIPEFDMNEFLIDLDVEDADFDTSFDYTINTLIKHAAGVVYTFGENRVEIPAEWIAKHLKVEG